MRNKEILNAFQRSLSRHRVNRNNDCKHHQNRHHHLGHPLNPVSDSRKDHRQRQGRKHQEPDLCGSAAGDKAVEIAVRCHSGPASLQVLKQVFYYPAADRGVIGHDQHGDHRVDPAAQPPFFRFSQNTEGPHRAFFRHPPNGRLRHNHGIPKGHGQQDIHQQEDPSAILCRQIRESPDIPKAH